MLLLFSACSRIELATSWADTYITHLIDHYFDINSLQSQLLKKLLKEDIKNIRKLVFPQLSLEFQEIERDVESLITINVDKLISYKTELRKIAGSGLGVFEASAQEFVNQLNPSQIEKFKKEFDKKTNELESEAKNPQKARENRYDKIKKQLEGWIGSLYSEQKKDVQKFCNENVFPIKEQVLNRNRLSKEFVDSFPDKEKRKEFIHRLFYNYESMREPDYAIAIEKDQRKYFELIAVILNRLNNEQKKHFIETLKDRADQLRKASESKIKKIF